MNQIEHIYLKSKNFPEFAKGYISHLHSLLANLDLNVVNQFIYELESARENDQTVFIIGNGGSAATASHMANDFAIGSTRAGADAKPFRVLSLSDNVAAMTAIANDFGYDQLFLSQLKTQFRRGDKLVVISASGNSPNLITAASWVKKAGGTVIGLLGFDGGKLASIVDVNIVVKTAKGEYGPVEDTHMILDHIIYSWLRQSTLNKT